MYDDEPEKYNNISQMRHDTPEVNDEVPTCMMDDVKCLSTACMYLFGYKEMVVPYVRIPTVDLAA